MKPGFPQDHAAGKSSAGARKFASPCPVTGRYAIAVESLVNYCDRLLIKLERDRCFVHMRHSPMSPAANSIEECWWRDVDLVKGDTLVGSRMQP